MKKLALILTLIIIIASIAVSFASNANTEKKQPHELSDAANMVADNNLRLFESISINAEINIVFAFRKNAVSTYNDFYVEITKFDSKGNLVAVNLYGPNQERSLTESANAYSANYKDLFPQEYNLIVRARLVGVDANGIHYAGEYKTVNPKEKICETLINDDVKPEQMCTLASDMLMFSREAQIYYQHKAENMITNDLLRTVRKAVIYYATPGNVSANKQNTSNTGPTKVSLLVLHEPTARVFIEAPKEAVVKVNVYDHATGEFLCKIDTDCAESETDPYHYGDYSIPGDKMRTEYDFVAEINGVDSPAYKWSIEGVLTDARANGETDLASLLNAMMKLGDSYCRVINEGVGTGD